MQEKFPIFILAAAGLLDLSGAPRSEHRARGLRGLSFPGGAESSAAPSEVFSMTEDNSGEVTFNSQSPAVGPSSERTADSIPVRTETAATGTATQPKETVSSLEAPEHLRAEAAALNLQGGHTRPSKLLSNVSIAVSTQGPQAATLLERPEGSPQGKPVKSSEAGSSPGSSSAALPQPLLSAGTQQGSPAFPAVSSVPVIAPSPKTSLLTSTVNFHPPREEIAASPLPSRVTITLGSSRADRLPAGSPPASQRPNHTNPPAQPHSQVAYLGKTQSADAQATTPAFLQKAASGGLGTVYSRTTQTTPIRFSPVFSLEQESAASKARSTPTAVRNGSGHPAPWTGLPTLPQSSVHSSSSPMPLEALGHDDLLPPPPEGAVRTTDRQQPLSLSQTLSCTKPRVSQETNRSCQELAVLVLHRETDHRPMTSKPEKSRPPGSPQASANSSLVNPSWIYPLKRPQTPEELQAVTPALLPGTPALGHAALPPANAFGSVRAGLQPAGASPPAYAGLQGIGTPSPAEKGLRVPASSAPAGSGCHVQGAAAHPVSQGFPGRLQVSTVEDSERKKGLPQEVAKTGSPPLTPQASPVPSPSALRDSGNQKAPLQSFAPSASQTQQGGSLAAFASKLPSLRVLGSQASSATARPELAVPSASEEVPADQFGASHDAATRELGALGGDQLAVLPPSPDLSFLLHGTGGMVCLQPTQDSPLPAEFPGTSAGRLPSVQQVLAAANPSALNLASLHNRSQSSLLLVKPVFILSPTDRPGLQVVPSPEGEEDHRAALLFTNKQDLDLGTPDSSQDVPVKTNSSCPASKSLRPEPALSAASNHQAGETEVTSPPALTNPSHTATSSVPPAVTSAPKRLPDPPMRTSPAEQAVPLHRLPEGTQVPAPGSRGAKGTDLLLLNVTLAEPFTPAAPPVVVSAQPSPRIAPELFFTAEKSRSSPVIPLLSATGLAGFEVPAPTPFAVTGTADQVQRGEKPALQATGPHQGVVTASSSVRARCSACSTLRSAGTISYPLETVTSITPLQSASQSLPSTESLQRLPPHVQSVPSTSSAVSALPVGHGHRDSAAGSTACSGGVAAKAARSRTTSVNPHLAPHSGLTPIAPKPFTMTERPTAAPARTSSSAELPMKTTVPGKLLATVTHPRTRASSSSPASTRVPLPSAAKRDQIHPAPPTPFSRANKGEDTKPETSTSARKVGTGEFLGTSVSLSATFNTRTQQPPPAGLSNEAVPTPAQPPVPAAPPAAPGSQPEPTRLTSQPPLARTSLSAANDDVTASFTSKKVFPLPTPAARSDPGVVLPTTARVSRSAVVSPSAGKSEALLATGDAATARQLPTPAPASPSHQASARHPWEKVPPEDTVEQEPAHCSPVTVTQATGPNTATASAVSARACVNEVAANAAEMLLAGDLTQVRPAPESPPHSAGSLAAFTPQENSLLAGASTGQSERLLSHTEAEEGARTNEGPEEAAEGLVTVLTPLEVEPGALLSDPHQRRGLQPDAAARNGLAVVSDDVCGSGNYTVQMSLRPAAESSPEAQESAPSPETFLASVAVQSDSSQPVLRIRSCCVTPSASPGGPGAVCCLFRRLPFECRHIRLLQSSRARAASFAIQLFQMLNHSVAYLHCELNVCLHGKPGCEQDCFGSAEPILQPSDRSSYGNPHNLISFGPVLRMNNRFLRTPEEGPDSAMLVPVVLGSLTGFAVLGGAFISLWLHHRQKTKTARCPEAEEIHGL